jgi:hypothetical protein
MDEQNPTLDTENLPIDQERKEALLEFQKKVKQFENKQNVYTNPKLYSRFGHPGSDFEVRNRLGNKILKCHRSVSGTLYIIDKNGSRRKISDEILDRIIEEDKTLTESSLPNIRTVLDDLNVVPAKLNSIR